VLSPSTPLDIGAKFSAGEGGGVGASWASNGLSESSSGSLFRAVRSRTYQGPRLFSGASPSPTKSKAKSRLPLPKGRSCKNWAVTTTIFPPTKTVNQISALADWCLVIAGDKKTPKVYNVSGSAIYLSPEDQKKLNFKTSGLLRWNHFGRKNLGFLYAIQHGARWVYDTDDDNELQRPDVGIPLPRLSAMVAEVSSSHPVYNLYPSLSTVKSSWPRGFPLDSIKDNWSTSAAVRRRAWYTRHVGVIQSLADHDPDVDGIYRLTQPLPFEFPAAGGSNDDRYGGSKQQSRRSEPGAASRSKAKAEELGLITLRAGTMMPYNAQATLHAYHALWGLLLPITVHGRVTDIWRAYFTQRLLWDLGSRIAFSTPWVTQFRNAHNYLADFNSELPLYQQSGSLVELLLKWRPTSTSIAGRLEELYILMYEVNVIGMADVQLVQAWIDDLISVGYEFPPLSPTHFGS